MCCVHKEDRVKHALQLQLLQGSLLHRGSLPETSGLPQTSSLEPFGLLANTTPPHPTNLSHSLCSLHHSHTDSIQTLFFVLFPSTLQHVLPYVPFSCFCICFSFLLFILIIFYSGTVGVHVHQQNVNKGQMYSILLPKWGRQICWFMLMSQCYVRHPSNIRCFLL